MVAAVNAVLLRLEESQRSSPLAVGALLLARELDGPGTKPSEMATCMRELRATLAELAKLEPAVAAQDDLSAIRSKREKRRGA